jgi:BirA family biotin operon repressor/biotin-[acetyl-CoA-carboxylase] ligase
MADILSNDPLDAAVVNAALGALARRFRVDILETCDSTNSVLLERAQQGAPSGSVVVCERQSAGRGRRGRAWLSAPGDSLTLSLLWRLPEGSPPPSGLSLAVGVAVARALEGMGAAGIGLKWPNDILAVQGKLGGILIELVSGAGGQAAAIGIGLNVRLPRAMAEAIEVEATDLSSVMAYPPSRNLLLAALLRELDAVLDEFARSGFAGWREEWLSRHVYTGRMVRLLSDGAPAIEGRCAGVDADGALLLDTDAGVQRIVSGDLTLRPS